MATLVTGGSISCDIADDQVSKLVGAIELEQRWMEEVMAIIAVEDQVEETAGHRKQVRGKLQRLGKAYVDGLYQEGDYRREKLSEGSFSVFMVETGES